MLAAARVQVPPDPLVRGRALDSTLAAIRVGLRPHRRRLWLRRAVRRGWIALALVALAEAAVAFAQRAWPLEAAPLIALAIPVLGAVGLLAAVALCRPSLGETAMAIDAEAHTGDAIASALAFAGVRADGETRDAADADLELIDVGPSFDLVRAEARFIRRQRLDALRRLIAIDPGLFRPRLDRRRALVAIVAALVVAPALLLPNPQDAVIARDQAVRDAAQAQAARIDEAARQLAAKGTTPTDPRSKLSEELRQLAEQLRQKPGDLQANLAKLGAVQDAIGAQLDPSNEQRASALAAAARALSQTATGNPQANPDADTKVTHEDLNDLGARLDSMTPAQRAQMATALAALQQLVTQADSTAGQALQDAASSIAQGDVAGAKTALDKLGAALEAASAQVQQNRDLAEAASQLQDAQRAIADAGNPQGQTAQASGKGSGQPGSNGNNGQGAVGPPGASGGTGQGQGQGRGQGSPGSSSGPGSSGSAASPGASGAGQAQNQGQGQSPAPAQSQGNGAGIGQQPGQGQGQTPGGSLSGGAGGGGGGTNAKFLGSGNASGAAKAPTGPNRAATLGPDVSSVYAPFDRLGKPGDPSYVAGTGGDGQLQQGTQQGQGANNGSTVPYQQVWSDFYTYAQTTLDRSYVPSSVKDYVRDYFSSLDPQQ